MVKYCSVPQCSSSLTSSHKCGSNIAFHLFPKDDNLKALWRIKLRIGKPVTKYMYVCSLHFKREDYILPDMPSRKRKLKRNAIPSQKLPVSKPEHPPEIINLRQLWDEKTNETEVSDKNENEHSEDIMLVDQTECSTTDIKENEKAPSIVRIVSAHTEDSTSPCIDGPCSYCLQFGHSAAHCRNKAKCAKCGLSHKLEDCKEEDPSCFRCGKAHLANSKECEKYKFELGAHEVSQRENIPLKIARDTIKNLQKTYANLFKPSSTHPKVLLIRQLPVKSPVDPVKAKLSRRVIELENTVKSLQSDIAQMQQEHAALVQSLKKEISHGKEQLERKARENALLQKALVDLT